MHSCINQESDKRQMLRQLAGQISAQYSPSKIRKLIYVFFVQTKDHITGNKSGLIEVVLT